MRRTGRLLLLRERLRARGIGASWVLFDTRVWGLFLILVKVDTLCLGVPKSIVINRR